jgi:hypothetical protein
LSDNAASNSQSGPAEGVEAGSFIEVDMSVSASDGACDLVVADSADSSDDEDDDGLLGPLEAAFAAWGAEPWDL